MSAPTWAYDGNYKKGTSLFTVVPGNEIISSGPYFFTAEEALVWGFHQYVIHNPVSIPMKIDWDDLPQIPVDLNYKPDLLSKSYYNDLPPVLIQVNLDRDYVYDTNGLEDSKVKFDPQGENVNADDKTLTPTVRNFYNPKSLFITKSTKANIALYKIYHKIAYSAIEPLEPGTKLTTGILSQYKLERLFKHKAKTETYFWRLYTCIRIASPQDTIDGMVRVNLNWPSMIFKFFNYISATREIDYNKINEYIFNDIPSLAVFVDKRKFGLNNIDANLMYEIVSRVSSRYDFINLLSLDKRTRRWFNMPHFQKLFIMKFSRLLIPDFFSEPNNIVSELYLSGIISKRDNKIARMGLVLDGKSLELMNSDIKEAERMLILKKCNTFMSTIPLVITWMSRTKNNMFMAISSSRGAMVKRSAYMPYKSLNRTNLFSRTNDVDVEGSIEKMAINGTWAFDLPSSAMQDIESSISFLEALKSSLRVNYQDIDCSSTIRMYNQFGLEMEIIVKFRFTVDDKEYIKVSLGPYESNIKDTGPFGSASKDEFLRNMGVDLFKSPAPVALNPYYHLNMETVTLGKFINVIYPYINFAVRWTVINKGIVRVDLSGAFY